jgi:hypothetical protein
VEEDSRDLLGVDDPASSTVDLKQRHQREKMIIAQKTGKDLMIANLLIHDNLQKNLRKNPKWKHRNRKLHLFLLHMKR